ncbi:MAG: hypothetical protein KVP17_004751 [Porospora cf. gigantea B]|uniref:uncharacterized protein n=1 Tax=Porospora cf. gigantea B TaxID=2853592 RepID=UPI0035719236|nr:MAG: hypothetical protein KVP17_004751 [Porospora cf. gigantea B]
MSTAEPDHKRPRLCDSAPQGVSRNFALYSARLSRYSIPLIRHPFDLGEDLPWTRQLLRLASLETAGLELRNVLTYDPPIPDQIDRLLSIVPDVHRVRVVCPIEECGEAFVSRTMLRYHLDVHFPSLVYRCPRCDFTSNSSLQVKTHFSIHNPSTALICPLCDWTTHEDGGRALMTHIQTAHPDPKPTICVFCKMHFPSVQAVVEHFLAFHPPISKLEALLPDHDQQHLPHEWGERPRAEAGSGSKSAPVNNLTDVPPFVLDRLSSPLFCPDESCAFEASSPDFETAIRCLIEHIEEQHPTKAGLGFASLYALQSPVVAAEGSLVLSNKFLALSRFCLAYDSFTVDKKIDPSHFEDRHAWLYKEVSDRRRQVQKQNLAEYQFSSREVADKSTETEPQPSESALLEGLSGQRRKSVIRAVSRARRESVPEYCNVCDVQYTSHDAYNDHLKYHAMAEFSCPKCSATFPGGLWRLRQHLKSVHAGDKECPLCRIAFHKIDVYQIHKLSDHPPTENVKQFLMKCLTFQFQRDEAEGRFGSATNETATAVKAHLRRSYLELCKLIPESWGDLVNTEEIEHQHPMPPEAVYHGPLRLNPAFCWKVLPQDALRVHSMSCLDRRIKDCFKEFAASRVAATWSGRIFLCPVERCAGSFFTKATLDGHLRRSHQSFGSDTSSENPLPYRCDVFECTETFQSLDAMLLHSANHGTLPCPSCTRSFIFEKTLEDHINQTHHQRQVVFTSAKCKHCGETFRQRSELRAHIRAVHVPPCSVCGKELASLESLKRHVRTKHLNVRLYHCRGCCQGFNNPAARKEHEKGCNWTADGDERLDEQLTDLFPAMDSVSFNAIDDCRLTVSFDDDL